MICRHFGKIYSLDSLSQICVTTNAGVSFLGISKAANELGLHNRCGKFTVNQLQKVDLPCILHWNQNHFVVLYKIKLNKKGNIFYIADPGKALVKCNEKDFVHHWISVKTKEEGKGFAMFFEPTSDFYNIEHIVPKRKPSFTFLLKYVKQYKRYFGQIVLGLLVGCFLQLIFPFLTQAIVDVGVKHQSLSIIWLILLGQLILTVSRTTVDFIRRWILLHISMRINIALVSDFFIKLLKLPMSFFDSKLMGDLMQRMNDHKRVEQFLTNQTLSVMFSLLSFLVFGIVLFVYNQLIFCVFILGSLVYGIWMAVFLKKRKILDYLLFERQAENNNKTYQFITSIQEIKLQDCERRRRWEWEDIQADMFRTQMNVLKLQQSQEAGSIFINEIKNIVITIIAATSVIKGDMTLGMMLAVQYILGQLNSPVEQLMGFLYSLQDVKISLERINEIHDMTDEESVNGCLMRFPDNNKDIHFRNVDFKYSPDRLQKTIDNVEFTIPKGKVTAIVGASGSGKTTLIKLLLGYYPVSSGVIRIGETPINRFNLKWWRRQCGVVMQDGIIFSESIARNIAVDDDDIDNTRLMQAVEISNIKDYIMELPMKFNTLIGRDGIGLSQGQKQRILIARAVYKNPEYIFLDEATNALDAKNERIIVENLDAFYKGKTVIVVAHRLSTVKNAEQVIVLNKGKIVEVGNHNSLIEKRGMYYNLVKNQLELGN